MIGTCGFHCWDEDSRRAEIGYDLAHAFWGQGLMREAVEAALAFGFGPMGLATIYAGVEPPNVRSIGLLERLGFERQEAAESDGLWMYEISRARSGNPMRQRRG